jgi:transcriptional regulator with XRE-family HTH domain
MANATQDPVDVIASNLKTLRAQHGYTMEQAIAALAQRGLTLQLSTLSRLENGKRALKLHEAPAIADLYGISLAWLLVDPIERMANTSQLGFC